MLLPRKTWPLHKSFAEIYKDVEGHTMIDEAKLQILYEIAIMVSLLPGDIAEAGVWEGGSLYLLASVLHNKKIHGFDSWEGLPKANPDKDGAMETMQEGWGKCDIPIEYLSEFDDRLVLYKG